MSKVEFVSNKSNLVFTDDSGEVFKVVHHSDIRSDGHKLDYQLLYACGDTFGFSKEGIVAFARFLIRCVPLTYTTQVSDLEHRTGTTKISHSYSYDFTGHSTYKTSLEAVTNPNRVILRVGNNRKEFSRVEVMAFAEALLGLDRLNK